MTWLNSGGVGPYTSELVDDNGSVWYGPNSGLNPVTLLNTLPPGLYNLNVEDLSGCFATINIPVINPDSLSIEFVANDVLCFGDNNGSISAIASGEHHYLMDHIIIYGLQIISHLIIYLI